MGEASDIRQPVQGHFEKVYCDTNSLGRDPGDPGLIGKGLTDVTFG